MPRSLRRRASSSFPSRAPARRAPRAPKRVTARAPPARRARPRDDASSRRRPARRAVPTSPTDGDRAIEVRRRPSREVRRARSNLAISGSIDARADRAIAPTASEHRARRRPSCCARSRDERCEATTRGDARRRRRRARARRGDDDARARGDARDVRRVGERSIAGREGRRRRATATRDGDARARARTDGDAVWFRGVGWGVRARGATDVRGGRGGAGDGELGRDQDGGVVRRLAQGAHGAAKGCR